MTTEQKIIEILAEEMEKNSVSYEKDINIESDLTEDLSFDSIMILQFVLRLEEEFNIEIDDEQLNNEIFESVGKVVGFIKTHLTEEVIS
ncbi:phosphopantetheine-binding protein [Bacillus sp. MUM 13]|uniref:acyl carrier protein n=1 Tax=Bacillus sp. MUM 13 TaxID=1678001 RepID=UPI0008F5D4FB|nr:phosphopantetheine-binding protein [Bacillus sp. MUM 13]OIK06814.1 hypothetical protein BIV59_21330 [Bacillus sp. MUM 13]